MKSFLSILVLLLVLVLEVRAQTWAEGDIQVSRKLSTAGFAPAELAFGSGLNVAYDNTSKTITVTTSGGAGLGTVTSFAFTNSTGITGTVTNATTTPTLALSLTSAAVGLGNVENTALSTWAGSSALTTLGTITTGTWQGTAIGDAYISSAATWNAKQAPGNYLTALTGDVTASGPGSAAATIANAAVTAAKLASNAARDNLTGGTGTLNLSAFTLTLPSDVTRLGSSIDLGSEVTGTLPWASVSKTGSSLADLATRSATDLTSGTLPDARFPATLPAASGTNLTSLDPYNLQQRSATNGQALVWNTTNSRWQPGTVSGGSGTPGGNDTELQYNNAGAFGGVDILWVSQSLFMPTNSTGTRAQLGMYSGSITSDIPAKAGDLLTYGGNEAATAQDSDADGGAGGDIRTYGGNGFATGSSGGDRPGGSGGTIDTSGGNASAGVAGRAGGSITTSNGGGSIDTTGSGSLQLGVSGTRTTVLGAASSNWTLTLPTGPGSNGQVMTTNGSGTTSWTTPSGSGTVTSVGGTGTVNGLTLTGTVTTSGNLTLGGTLSGVSLTSAVTGTLPVANGGTGITALGTGVATALGQNVIGTGGIVLGTGTASGLTAGEATAALGLKTATTTVSVSGAAAPTSGQVLTATSGTAATWQTPSAGSGDMVLLASATASASSEILFDNVFDAAVYAEYELRFQGVQSATDNVALRVQLRDATPADIATFHRNVIVFSRIDSTLAGSVINSGGTTGWNYSAAMGNAANELATARFTISPISGQWTHMYFQGYVGQQNSNDRYSFTGAGSLEGTTTPAGVKIYMSSGNISIGTFQLYGLKK
jgi:hypothetical protein